MNTNSQLKEYPLESARSKEAVFLTYEKFGEAWDKAAKENNDRGELSIDDYYDMCEKYTEIYGEPNSDDSEEFEKFAKGYQLGFKLGHEVAKYKYE